MSMIMMMTMMMMITIIAIMSVLLITSLPPMWFPYQHIIYMRNHTKKLSNRNTSTCSAQLMTDWKHDTPPCTSDETQPLEFNEGTYTQFKSNTSSHILGDRQCFGQREHIRVLEAMPAGRNFIYMSSYWPTISLIRSWGEGQ